MGRNKVAVDSQVADICHRLLHDRFGFTETTVGSEWRPLQDDFRFAVTVKRDERAINHVIFAISKDELMSQHGFSDSIERVVYPAIQGLAFDIWNAA